ncbi:NAD(P)-binding protein [Pluteus cervinus]|uniref:NAD(P)-binding protein n=1 Tax=Pluteus cervinus TaxID=181527 RepID=A0ACD3AVG8_9AGAR|nr:NAD(P)-binding protein [Pluteus cervinus]
MSNSLVWLITGTSTGIGRLLTESALKRGDRVIATARGRSISQIADLKEKGAATLELDVTAPQEKLDEIAKEAAAIYGQIDVIVNNAGYILVGAVEENTAEETLQQFNTNVFGALNVTRAFLPYLRQRKSGYVIFIGSVGGWRGVPNAGLYAATKYTLRGITASLDLELSPLGIRATCVDLGYFRTPFLSSDHRAPQISRIPDYQEMTDKANASLAAYNGRQPGDPQKGVNVILDVIRGEGVAVGKPFPSSLQLGSDCYRIVKEEQEKTLTSLELWKDVSISTDFPEGT